MGNSDVEPEQSLFRTNGPVVGKTLADLQQSNVPAEPVEPTGEGTARHRGTAPLVRMPHKERKPVTLYAGNLQESLEQVHEFTRSHLKLASDHISWQHDTHAEEVALKCGDPVWLHCPIRKKGISPKLSRPWQGPFLGDQEDQRPCPPHLARPLNKAKVCPQKPTLEIHWGQSAYLVAE